jgi:hypothetical protein
MYQLPGVLFGNLSLPPPLLPSLHFQVLRHISSSGDKVMSNFIYDVARFRVPTFLSPHLSFSDDNHSTPLP